MSDTQQTIEDPRSWNFVTLRAFLESQIEGVRREADTAAKNQAMAISKSEEAMTIRLNQMNEFREQITEERDTLMTKAEFQRFEDGLNRRLKDMEDVQKLQQNAWSNLQGRLTMLGGGLAIFMTIVVFAANYLTGN